MAKKPDYFSTVLNSFEKNRTALLNQQSRVGAFERDILPGLVQEGLPEPAISALRDQFSRTGNVDTAAIPNWKQLSTPAPVVAPSVVSPAAEQEIVEEEDRKYGRVWEKSRALSEALRTNIVAAGQESLGAAVRRAGESDNPYINSLARFVGTLTDMAQGDIGEAITDSALPAGVDTLETATELRGLAAQNREQVQQYREQNPVDNRAGQWLLDGLFDATSSPSSAASLIGGPAGAIPLMDAYDQAWVRADDLDRQLRSEGREGLTDQEKEVWAATQAAPELVEFIPANKLLRKLPGGDWIMDRAEDVIGRVAGKIGQKALDRTPVAQRLANRNVAAAVDIAKEVGGEATGEGLTNVTQGLSAAALAGAAEGEALRGLASDNAITSVSEGLEAFSQGAAAGVVFGSAKAPITGARAAQRQEQAIQQQAEDTLTPGVNQGLSHRRQVRPEQGPREGTEQERADAALNEFINAPRAEALEGTGQPAGRTIEPYADWAQREADAMPARQPDLPQDAEDFNRMPVPGVRGTAPFRATPRGAAVTAEQATAARDIDAIARENERVAQQVVEEQAAADTMRTEQERQRKAAEKKAAAEADKARKQAETQRRALIKRIAEENPGKSPVELGRLLVDAERAQQEGTPVPATQPEAPVVSTGTQAAPRAAVAKPDTEVTGKDIRDLLRAKGMKVKEPTLESEGSGTVRDSNDSDAQFVEKATRIVKSLANKQDQSSVDVQNLIRQGKLVLASTPESIGRTSQTAKAEFVPKEGKMYLYMDRIGDPNNVVPEVLTAVASHESVHAGQFNDRRGRPDLYKIMMGNKGNVNTIIRKAADNGNKLAKNALARAEKARQSATARGFSDDGAYSVQELEVLPYFVEEAVASRATTYGQLSGVVKDLRAGAKKLLNMSGLTNRDVSLNDIETAAKSMAGEIVQTDLSATQGPDVETEMGPSATGFAAARDRGDVYQSDIESGKYAFEVSDASLPLAAEDLSRLKVGGHDVAISDLFYHPQIAENYPDLWNKTAVRLSTDPSYRGSAHYDRTGQQHVINLNAGDVRLAAQGNEQKLRQVRSTLLHEIQHLIQGEEGWSNGANPESFMSPSVIASLDQSAERINDKVKKFEYGVALSNMPADSRAKWENQRQQIVVPEGMSQRDAHAKTFLDGGWYADSKSPTVKKFGESYETEAQEYSRALETKYEAEKKAFRTYMRNTGEVEARTTQARMDMTQEELNALPRSEQIITWRTTDGENITRRDAVDTDEFARQRRSIPSLSLESEAELNPVPETVLSDAEHLRRILNKGRNTETADIKRAEALDTRFRKAMKEDFGVRYDNPQTHKEILDLLKNVDEAGIDSQGTKWQEFQQKYPNLAPALADMRAEIDRGTDGYIEKLVNSGRDLSKDDINTIQTLLANRGKYLRRAYSALQGRGMGRKWGEDVWSDYTKNFTAYEQTPERLPPHVRHNVEIVRDALAFIEKYSTIPDNAGMAGLDTDRLEQLYNQHSDNRASRLPGDAVERRTRMIQELAWRRDNRLPEYDQLAEMAVKDLLGLTESGSAVAKVMADLAKNPGTLKERKNVPPEIRRLLGQIKDPGGVVLSTLSAQAALNSRMGIYHDLLTTGIGRHVLPPSRITEPGMRERFSGEPLSAEHGPLQGYYASPAVRAALDSQIEAFYTWGEALRLWKEQPAIVGKKLLKEGAGAVTGKLTRAEKYTSVIMNPARWLGNLVGSPLSLLRAGNFRLPTYLKGLRTGGDYVAGTAANSTSQLLDDAIRYVNIESVDVAEMQRILGGKMNDYLVGNKDRDAAQSLLRKAFFKANDAREPVSKTILAGYSILDNWTKIANFYDRVRVLQDYYQSADPDRSIEQIKEEAGHDTSYTNLSPERTWKAIRTANQYGLVKFAPYFSEVFRTTWTNFALGFKDIQRASRTENPEAKSTLYWSGVRRLIGNVAATAGVPFAATLRYPLPMGIAGGSLAMFLASNDDEENEKKRLMVSEFNRMQDLIQYGVDKNGLPIYMAASGYTDPHGPITDLLRTAINAEGADDAAAQIWNTFSSLFITPEWMNKAVSVATGNNADESATQDIANKMVPQLMDTLGDGLGTENITRAGVIFDSFLPGILRSQAPKAKPSWATAEDLAKMGYTKEEAQDMLDNMENGDALNKAGARMETLRPDRVLKSVRFQSNERSKENTDDLNYRLINSATLDGDRVQEAVTLYAADEVKRLTEDYRYVESMRSWGFDEATIARALEEAKWTKDEIAFLTSGQATPTVSVEKINNAFDRKITKLNDAEAREELEERKKKVTAFLQQYKNHFAEQGINIKEK